MTKYKLFFMMAKKVERITLSFFIVLSWGKIMDKIDAVRKMQTYIEEHLDEKITLSNLSNVSWVMSGGSGTEMYLVI